MNALATDQAGRLAQVIWNNPELRGYVTAGLYLGGRGEKPSGVMSEDEVISDREIMRQVPPDILLTNYKMLDYLLLRPEDAKLWNYNEPETLRYLVVDELHTFDGAQGADLACLIRRLKETAQDARKASLLHRDFSHPRRRRWRRAHGLRAAALRRTVRRR